MTNLTDTQTANTLATAALAKYDLNNPSELKVAIQVLDDIAWDIEETSYITAQLNELRDKIREMTIYRVQLNDEFQDDPVWEKDYHNLVEAHRAFSETICEDSESVQHVHLIKVKLDEEGQEDDYDHLNTRTVADVRKIVQQQIDERENVARWAADEYKGDYKLHSHGYYVALEDGRTIRIIDHAANWQRLERGDISIVISPFREERAKADLFDVLCEDESEAIEAIKNWYTKS